MSNKTTGWRKFLPAVLFCFVFIGLCLVYSYDRIILLRPQGLHVWRQADCLALTKNYYDNGLNFFHPGISQYLFNDFSTRETVGEFPVLYYAVAALWKIFGEHEWIYRVLSILIFSFGLWCLFKTVRLLTNSISWSLFAVAFIFSSPVVVYYTNNFLTDAPALGLALAATWYWIKHLHSPSRSALWKGALLFALAGLIKITALMLFCVFAGLWLLEKCGVKFFSGKKLFESGKSFLATLLSVAGINLLWLFCASLYNSHYNGWFTPNDIFPVWSLTSETLQKVNKDFSEYLLFQALNRPSLYLCGICFLLLIVFFRKLHSVARWVLVMLVTGVGAYFILFYKAFDLHDYYLIEPMVLPLGIVVIAIVTLKNNRTKLLTNVFFCMAFAPLMAYNVYYCAQNMKLRYFPPEKDIAWIDNKEVRKETMRWFKWDYDRRLGALGTIEPYLDSLGISKETKVVSMPDLSFNVSLYLMDRTGWTGHKLYTRDTMQVMIHNGAELFVVNDTAYAQEEPFMREYMKYPVGQYRNVMIYDLKPFGE